MDKHSDNVGHVCRPDRSMEDEAIDLAVEWMSGVDDEGSVRSIELVSMAAAFVLDACGAEAVRLPSIGSDGSLMITIQISRDTADGGADGPHAENEP